MPTTALIVAAGAGRRMGLPSPKAFLELAGRPLVEHSLRAFETHARVDGIVLMAPPAQVEQAGRIASGCAKVLSVAAGGDRRQDSVRLGLELVARLTARGDDQLVLVHDAARPLVEASLITSIIEAAARAGAALPGVAPADTVRETSAGAGTSARRFAARTLDRGALVLVQTPQGFRLSLLLEAYARLGGEEVTDDAALVQGIGHPVEVVPGSARNMKITTPGDFEIAEALLASGGGRDAPAGRR